MGIFKNWRTYIFILVDIVLINVSYKMAFYFRFTYTIPVQYSVNYSKSIIIIIFIYLICFYTFRLYDRLWNYASIDEFLLATGACITASLFSILYGAASSIKLPFGVDFLAAIFNVIFIVGFRMSFRIYSRGLSFFNTIECKNIKRVMVVGAGTSGILLVKEMKQHKENGYLPVAFMDDSKQKIGTTICGVKVMGNRHGIEMIAKNKNIHIILIAIASLDSENKRQLIDICKKTGCKIKIIPGICEILDKNISLSKIRDVNIEDLLGRETINLDMDGIGHYIKDRKVMVTGGGGSIGSELCRQIVKFNPRELIILDIYENNAYELQCELKYNYPGLKLKVMIASVRDRKRLENIFDETKPDVVFHAAAHKHVPLMEDNASEAIKNNVFGTLNVAECADKFGVKKFVMISTDKAVNPTNVMGATKRVCEMIIQSMDRVSETQFVAVRFGNVLGSNGSVIPLFKKQIEQGGPVTVTHKDITRYFMTIPEAAQLVLQAGAFAKGGEIFVLDMGKAVRIYDLACDLIRLSGFEPDRDIKVEVTGLRPGEKLYEEVLMDEEGLGNTGHEKIFVGMPVFGDIDGLKGKLEELIMSAQNDRREEIILKLQQLVGTYKVSNIDEVAITAAG